MTYAWVAGENVIIKSGVDRSGAAAGKWINFDVYEGGSGCSNWFKGHTHYGKPYSFIFWARGGVAYTLAYLWRFDLNWIKWTGRVKITCILQQTQGTADSFSLSWDRDNSKILDTLDTMPLTQKKTYRFNGWLILEFWNAVSLATSNILSYLKTEYSSHLL